MKYNLLAAISLLIIACTSAVWSQEKPEYYKNKSGDQIILIKENDTTMRTTFSRNNLNVLDTTMQIRYNFKLKVKKDSLPFLYFKGGGWGGLELFGDSLYCREYSNIAYLQMLTHFNQLYDGAFYKIKSK